MNNIFSGVRMAAPEATCVFCGESERAELHEVWLPRDFMLDTCCEAMHVAASDFLSEDPRGAARWLGDLGLGAVTGRAARRVIDDGAGSLVIDWNLEVIEVEQKIAKGFVRDHHRHCPPPAGWKFGAGVSNGSQMIGVAMVGRPVSRELAARNWLEVNRLCIRSDLADGLAWNACSLMYGWASRQAKKRRIPKIVTYTLESEDGTSLRAAGWIPEWKTKGGSWNAPSRPRQDKTSTEPKVRWAPAWCADMQGGALDQTRTGNLR